jgi:tryptophan-rich sensory protein
MLPCLKENLVLQKPNTQQLLSKPHRATLGFAFSIVGAILIFLRGIVRIVRGDVITFLGSDEIRHRFLAGLAWSIIGGIAVVFAVIIIVGAYLIYSRTEMAGGVIVLIFSVLSIFAGSGWLIGLILGVVGGVLALLKK